MVSSHHKRRATTSGSLETPPLGSLFPLPRGVERGCRWASIARALPPAEATARALSDQMEPFDRDYFAPWIGALRMAMPRIGKDAQRRHGVK